MHSHFRFTQAVLPSASVPTCREIRRRSLGCGMASARAFLPETTSKALALAIQFGSTVIIDLDGTLVPTGGCVEPPSSELVEALARLRNAGVSAVIVTNRRRAPHVIAGYSVLSRAQKPWTNRHRLEVSPAVTCVLGDQYATDGLLAVRLGVPLIKMPALDVARPYRSRLLDRVCVRFFERQDWQ